MSLLPRLLLLVAIALLPSLAIQGWDGVQRHRELASASRDAAPAQTRALQGDVVRLAERVRQVLVALSEVPSIRDRDAESCTAYLEAVAVRFGGYRLLGVTDASRQIFCNSAGVEPGAYSNAGRAYFQHAMATGTFASSDLVTGASTHRPSIHLALPVMGADGIVLARLDRDRAFDTVLPGVVMPGDMDGVALAREIRRRHPGLPVVPTSGYSHVLAREGPHGFDLVHKPYSAGQLAHALGRAVAVQAARAHGGAPLWNVGA